MKVDISVGVLRQAAVAAVKPIMEQHAADIAKTATTLAKQRLGKWDAFRQGPVGLYRNGMRVEPGFAGTPDVLIKTVVNDAPHAEIIEFGSRPHIIRPKRAGGRLRWLTGSGPVYARQVRHPGTRAYNVMADAARQTRLR